MMNPVTITDAEFRDLSAFIGAETGIDLHEAKRPLVCARLARRLRHWGYSSFREYWGHLCDHDPEGLERRTMVNAITTNKTAFFREPHHFEFLSGHVLPAIASRRVPGGVPRLRIWSAGCSTGEEPYSIAMTLLDSPAPVSSWDVRVLASDINTEVLDRAATGVYERARLAGVESGALRRHFHAVPREPHLLQVSGATRRLITFRHINLCSEAWPIQTSFDVIFCRNVVIYFDRATQRAVMRRLADLLAPGGHLIVGHSESLLGHGLDLEYAGRTVYRKPALAAACRR
jgi:chemotaxis protein methyltransferase CheR